MINNRQEKLVSDDLEPYVPQYTAPVMIGALCTLLALGIALIWGLDWRVFWSACLVAVGVVLATAMFDGVRRSATDHARTEANREQFREQSTRAGAGITRTNGANLSKIINSDPLGTIHPVNDQP